MHPGIKNRLSILIGITRVVFHWGFIPTILYLGYQHGSDPGAPQLSIFNLLWQ